jgi:RNA polymerase sigma-70 factor (ECF subfamily)
MSQHRVPVAACGRIPAVPEELRRRYAARVYRLACGLLDDGADAEAVTREALRQATRRRAMFRGEAELATWLHRFTVSAALRQRGLSGEAIA